MTNVVAIIPARYGSSRLPAKPLADICGKPMIQRVYERAAQAKRIARVIVATDDERIVRAVEAFGGNAVMTSPELQSGTDRIAAAVRSVPNADIIVNVQGDEPLIAPEMIDEGVAVVTESDALVGTLVQRLESLNELFNPNVVKAVLDNGGHCMYFSRSPIPFGRDKDQQDWLTETVYYKHVGLYVFRREFLLQYAAFAQTQLERAEKLEQLRILEHGFNIRAAVTTYGSMPVDTEADLNTVRAIFKQKYGNG